jgi:curved DNA-binding protein CbpA
MNLYDDLGIGRNADQAAIKSAHRRAAKLHHPDRGGEQEVFARIQRAFDVLSDPDKRRRYDETGAVADLPASFDQQAVFSAAREALFPIILGPADLSRIDVIGEAIEVLRKRLIHLEAQAGLIDFNLERLRLARERLSRPVPDGEDVVALMLDQQHRDLNGSRPAIETGVRVTNAAITLLRSYAYRVDAAGISLTISRSPDGGVNIG